uniref:Uncharacterized protein n=1 Tax=Solanum tuberosum TaxID=4113 RepID=M1DXA6_SOLTU
MEVQKGKTLQSHTNLSIKNHRWRKRKLSKGLTSFCRLRSNSTIAANAHTSIRSPTGNGQWAVASVVQFFFRNQTSVFTIKNRGTERVLKTEQKKRREIDSRKEEKRDSSRLQAVPEQQQQSRQSTSSFQSQQQQSRTLIPVEGLISSLQSRNEKEQSRHKFEKIPKKKP